MKLLLLCLGLFYAKINADVDIISNNVTIGNNVTIDVRAGENKIVGGVTADIRVHPYMVYLYYGGIQRCGGVLIRRNYVVTAAHCATDKTANDITVVGGVTYLTQPGIRRRVARIILPQNYNPNTRHMDIAVLRLAAPLNGPNTGLISLCSNTLRAGDYIRVLGWGRIETNGAPSNRLRKVSVQLISKPECLTAYASSGQTLTNSMFCAYTEGKDSCAGDSGGPALYKGQLCGVVSWGIECAVYPGVYTSVRAASTFIQNALLM